MREVKAKLGKEIQLGRVGENRATRVYFDVSEWENTEVGTVHLLHERRGDPAPYPCDIEVLNGVVTWVITESDVEIEGRGKAELQYRSGGVCIKSSIFTTNTLAALGPAGQKPPAPYEGWVSRVLSAINTAVESAKAALVSEKNAKLYAEDAEGHADDAKQQADKARENVEDALQEALDSGKFTGPAGPQGEPGMGGIAVPVAGFYTLGVDDDGNLWVYAEEDEVPDFEYDSETGALYIVQEV